MKSERVTPNPACMAVRKVKHAVWGILLLLLMFVVLVVSM